MNTKTVAERVGVTYRQLDSWLRAGYIDIWSPADGTGTPRLWSAHEVAVAERMARLVWVGFTPAAAGRIAATDAEAVNLGHGVLVEVDRLPAVAR